MASAPLCCTRTLLRPTHTTLRRQHPARSMSASPAALSHIGSAAVQIPPSVELFLDPWSGVGRRTAALRQTMQLVVRGPLGQMAVDLQPYVSLKLPAMPGEERPVSEWAQSVTSSSGTVQSSSTSATPSSIVSLPNQAGKLSVSVQDPKSKQQRAMWGLTRALVHNAVVGVTEGFTSKLKMVGVGYKGTVEDAPPAGASTLSLSDKPHQRLRFKLGYSNDVLVAVPSTPTFLGATFTSPTELELKGVDKREVSQLAASIRNYRKPEPYNGKGIFVNGETIKRKEVKKK